MGILHLSITKTKMANSKAHGKGRFCHGESTMHYLDEKLLCGEDATLDATCGKHF